MLEYNPILLLVFVCAMSGLVSSCDGFATPQFQGQKKTELAGNKDASNNHMIKTGASKIVDTSTISLLEHVNLNVPSHRHVKELYGDILGMRLDPRRAQNAVKGEGTLWFNCGASQFHLPYGETAQVWNGHLGLLYSSLDDLKDRLEKISTDYDDDDIPFAEYSMGIDQSTGQSHIRIIDHYGNIFLCRQEQNTSNGSNMNNFSLQQPILQSSNPEHVDKYGQYLCDKYGNTMECLGLKYVEYWIPPGTASKVGTFYESIFDATVTVMDTLCLVACGTIDTNGRAEQYIIFREQQQEEQPCTYDGHHLAIYVGSSQEDFEVSFERCAQAGVVWVNPRFSDCATTLDTARKFNQYRFKDVLDIDTGKVILTLEHEVRSIHHNSHPANSSSKN